MPKLRQETAEAAAPDQSSLAAAVKLLKPALWSNLGGSADGQLIWGDCQGSGANPYCLVVDIPTIGSKCSCPSRKFPCKHALALMLMETRGQVFAPADVPPWVSEWMARRRGGAASAPVARGETPSLAAVPEAPEAAPDPKAEARREAQRQKREAETLAAIRAGLDDLEGWIADQLRGGLHDLSAHLPGRCRQIAARLVDARIGTLAARVDEIPAQLQALPQAARQDALVAELGNLVLISRAWGDGSAADPGLRRQIATSETREVLLADPAALRVTACWRVLATREVTRRDGLVAQSTWLRNLPADLEEEVAIVTKRVGEMGGGLRLPVPASAAAEVGRIVTIFRELRAGQTLDGKTALKVPTGSLSTAEAIAVMVGGLSQAVWFMNGALDAEALAPTLMGAIVKDPVQDKLVLEEYLEGVLKKRRDFAGYYTALTDLL